MRKLAEGVYDLISDGLSLDLLDGPGIAQQLRRRFTTLGETGLATFMLGRYEAANPGEEMTKWKTRAIEDEKAIGGLRNPHLSIRKLKGSSAACKELTRMLEEHIEANYDVLSKTLDTLGKGEMPEILTKSANDLQRRVAELYGAELAEEDELRGSYSRNPSEAR